MSDDLDALLARADHRGQFATFEDADALINDLAAAVRTLRADYDTALDVIARLIWGWTPPDGPDDCWYLEPGMDDGLETELAGKAPVTDTERAVLAAAETRQEQK